MFNTVSTEERLLWGIVLAAGDGRRLQNYVQRLRGDVLPKQYFNFTGQRSMLEHTFHRVERLIPPERVITVVGKHHLAHPEVKRQLSERQKATVVVQPKNKETGPGVLLPLMFLFKRCPDAVVALFPSDHFILEEDRFMSYVQTATQAVRHDPSRIVLLGVEAREAETEYGYILPGDTIGRLGRFGTREVSTFVEKPGVGLALELIMTGALWNTMAIVFEIRTFLDLVRRVCPSLYYEFFCAILESLGTSEEQKVIESAYEKLEPVNFSKGIMEKIADRHPQSISVLPVRRVFWSDWGSPQRVLQVLRTLGRSEEQSNRNFREKKMETAREPE